MELENYYWYYDSAIPKETCERIITLGEKQLTEIKNSGQSTNAVTFGNTEKQVEDSRKPLQDNFPTKEYSTEKYYNRDSEVCWIEDKWLYDIILPYVKQANISAGWNWDIDSTETIQFTKYSNSGFYGWHTDGRSDHIGKYKRYIYGVTPTPLKKNSGLPEGFTTNNNYVGKVRKISLSVNLSSPESYEGGDLFFKANSISEKETVSNFKNQGSIVIFPSFLNHCVSPVTKGNRYSLVIWCLGRPWK